MTTLNWTNRTMWTGAARLLGGIPHYGGNALPGRLEVCTHIRPVSFDGASRCGMPCVAEGCLMRRRNSRCFTGTAAIS